MGVSKVVYGNSTLIDLTNDTVEASKLAQGYTAHGADGNAVTGTATLAYARVENGVLYMPEASVSGQVLNV